MLLPLGVVPSAKLVQVALELSLVSVEKKFIQTISDLFRIVFPQGVEINQLGKECSFFFL